MRSFRRPYWSSVPSASLQFTNQIALPALSDFRALWKDGPLSGAKKLERLRAVGRFFLDRGWWRENLALKLKRPKVKETPTMPYTHKEMATLLTACDQYTDWHGRVGQENARRLRAFVLLARYSALRVSDAASCAVDRLSGNRLFLYTQKTGVPVYVPLPPFVVEALESCPCISERYWFWTGVGSKETLAGNWRRTFRRLCEIAGVEGGHPHRFRDTLGGGATTGGGADRAGLCTAGAFVGKDYGAPLRSMGAGASSCNLNRTWCGPGGTTRSRKWRCCAATGASTMVNFCKRLRHICDTKRRWRPTDGIYVV